MLNRILRNGIMDVTLSSQGYLSQEEEEDDERGSNCDCSVEIKATKSSGVTEGVGQEHGGRVSAGEARRGRGKDSGWTHHVAMRTCTTEV
jgi:hypothetical protein